MTSSTNQKPGLLPEPLRGKDIPSFANDTIVRRLPAIARRVISENSFSENSFSREVNTRIEQLIADIPTALIRSADIPLAPDAAQWARYIQPYLDQNWLQVPWFFAEEYFYLRILEATGYFKTGSMQGVDPYATQKRQGLETTTGETRMLCQSLAETLAAPAANLSEALRRLLIIDLWGNQNDLSIFPAGGGPGNNELREATENILVDDSQAAVRLLTGLHPQHGRIDFIIDNAGYELICDLALVDLLLTGKIVSQVVFHLKQQPVFVSDAMVKDVMETLQFLAQQPGQPVKDFARRLDIFLTTGQLKLLPNGFWTSPYPAWELPGDLEREFQKSNLLIFKGDANYRRILGDLHWPLETPFSSIMHYLPAPVLALRSIKSEIAVGLMPNQIPTTDPHWMTNGRWGLIQFSPAYEDTQRRV